MIENKDIKAALWSQGLSATDSDYFVIDGESSRDSDTKKQIDVLVKMNTKQLPLIKKHGEGDNLSSAFKVKKDKDWFYVEGNFNETDSAGRLRVYRFLIHSNESKEVVSTLQSYAKSLGCSIHQPDIKEITRTFNKKNNKIVITLCVIILTIAIIIFLR